MSDLTIPEIRKRLIAIGKEIGNTEIIELAEATKRRSNGRRAKPKRGPLSYERILTIRQYAVDHPNAQLNEIAEHFNTNQGRVSEALFGKRGEAA